MTAKRTGGWPRFGVNFFGGMVSKLLYRARQGIGSVVE